MIVMMRFVFLKVLKKKKKFAGSVSSLRVLRRRMRISLFKK
jgi:hypothetical protein